MIYAYKATVDRDVEKSDWKGGAHFRLWFAKLTSSTEHRGLKNRGGKGQIIHTRVTGEASRSR